MVRRAVPIEEKAFRLRLDGRDIATWTCTPARLDTLAAGWLLANGFVDGRSDILEISVSDEQPIAGASVRLGDAAASALSGRLDHRATAACGVRHFLDCEPARLPVRDPAAPASPDSAAAAELLREMYARAERYREHGGLHVAALVGEDGDLMTWAEEVGRHNAADKIIGEAWLDGVRLGCCGLLLSARVSGQIALKGARAGLAWIASRSVPTTLALEIAGVARLPIVARAGGDEARTFSPPVS